MSDEARAEADRWRAEAEVLGAMYEIMRQASYLPRWSPERRRIEDAASDVLRAVSSAQIDGSGAP